MFMNEICNFLKENPIFYFATVEDNKPKVRPFGFFMNFENKLYFGIGKHKKSYKQILNNPNVEVCTCSAKGEWIRISGEAHITENENALRQAFDVMPKLKEIYNSNTKMELGLLYLENGIAEFADMNGNFKTIKF